MCAKFSSSIILVDIKFHNLILEHFTEVHSFARDGV